MPGFYQVSANRGRGASALLLLIALMPHLCAQVPAARQQEVEFTAEVSRGEGFVHEIAPGLYFYLKPVEQGWSITISPSQACNTPNAQIADYRDDYVYVVTPPFRFRNAQALTTEYNTPAREALGAPHEFQFVTNCEAFLAEMERVQFVLWPGTVEAKKLDAARARIGRNADGHGRLEILDSRITDDGSLGVIEWLRFRVRLEWARPSQ